MTGALDKSECGIVSMPRSYWARLRANKRVTGVPFCVVIRQALDELWSKEEHDEQGEPRALV